MHLRGTTTYPCGYRSVGLARRAVVEFATACGFRDAVLHDIESAVGEALANAAEHGDPHATTGFAVNLAFDGTRLIVEVKDEGPGFDSESRGLERPAPAGSSVRGLGIFIMRSLMDEVTYSERGARIRLVKQLDRP